MRILHVAPYFAPAWSYGGTPRAVYELARCQQRAGHSVTVLTTDALGATERAAILPTEVQDGVRIMRVRNLANRLVWKQHFLLPVSWPTGLDVGSFDVVHLHETRTLLNTIVLGLVKPAQLVVFSPWGTLPFNDRLASVKRVLDLLWLPRLRARVDVALGQTEHELEVLRAFGVGQQRVVVPLGIDPGIFKRLPTKAVARKLLGLEKSARVFLFLGRFAPAKGLGLLLRAFVKLASTTKQPVRLVCVGRDDGYLPEMRQFVQRHKNIPITIMKPLYEADRLAAYVAADWFVFTPTVFEETSTACLEALCCGCPVVTTEQAAIPLSADPPWLMQVPASEKAVLQALTKAAQLSRTSPQSLRVDTTQIKRYFSWTSIARRLTQLYEKNSH